MTAMSPGEGQLLVATRSGHKLREIREILSDVPGLRILDLDEAGIPESDQEDALEEAETFSENALAKARYFAERSGLVTIADDSGLEVDALEGRPGVRSRRFAPAPADMDRDARDRLNVEYLLQCLDGVPQEERTARFVTEVALVQPKGPGQTFRGQVEGIIIQEPRGDGGFGYDPVFLYPPLGGTFAEIPAGEKARVGHRGVAMRRLAAFLAHEGGMGRDGIDVGVDS